MRAQTWRYPFFVMPLMIGLLSYLPLISYGSNIAQVTVKVTIVAPPPCTINNNQVIEVDFGDVLTNRVDGNEYRRPINYNLSCSSGQLIKNALKLQIAGEGINLGSVTNALKVNESIPDFGIQLQHNTTPLRLNTWVNFTYPDAPTLYAVPVKRAGSTLITGSFTAASTMKVEYQ